MKKKSLLLLLLIAVFAVLAPLLFANGCSPVAAAPTTQTTTQPTEVSDFSITVDGLVDNQLTIDRASLTSYPSITEEVLLECPGFFKENHEWTGVPLSAIFKQAGIQPQATEATFYGSDGYNYTLPVKRDDDGNLTVLPAADQQTLTVILAFISDGNEITGENPVRLVVPGAVGAQWVNHLVRIEVK